MDFSRIIDTLTTEPDIVQPSLAEPFMECHFSETVCISDNNNSASSELQPKYNSNNNIGREEVKECIIHQDISEKSHFQISFKRESRFALFVCWEIVSQTNELQLKPSWLLNKPENKWIIIDIRTSDSTAVVKFIQETKQGKGVQKVDNLDPDAHYVVVLCCVKHRADDCPACVKSVNSIKGTSFVNSDAHKLVIHTKCQQFQTVLNMEEMRILQQKAEVYVSSQNKEMQFISQLYRNKSPEYFCNILANEPGSRIMIPYLKDDNGDPGCPINGRINGLFFSGIKHKNSDNPSPISPFGTHRFLLPAKRLLNETKNLYFSDFYCYGMEVHYINVVVTNPGSETDTFCSNRLPKLDLFDNQFLMLKKDVEGELPDEASVEITPVVHVEIFYTEEVNVEEELDLGAKIHCTDTIGRGHALPEGVPKNSLCPKCNI